MNNILTITNLSKKYKGNERYSVKDLSFEVKEGELFAFLGPNGAHQQLHGLAVLRHSRCDLSAHGRAHGKLLGLPRVYFARSQARAGTPAGQPHIHAHGPILHHRLGS